MRTRIALVGLLALVALSACGGNDDGTGTGGTTTPTDTGTAGGNAVQVADDVFQPASLTVTSGSTVTWTWAGSNPHTVTSTDTPPAFDSGDPKATGTFQHTFSAAGTFAYRCVVHPDVMTGTIVVT